jgi:hypothetical protein
MKFSPRSSATAGFRMLSVAPRLLSDPVDHGIAVPSFVLIGLNRVGTQPFAARIGAHPDVTMTGRLLDP